MTTYMTEGDPNMADHVKTIIRGAWQATIIDRNGPHRNQGVCEKLRYMVRLSLTKGYLTDWPIRYNDGQIGYCRFPSRDAKRAARAAFRFIDSITKTGNES